MSRRPHAPSLEALESRLVFAAGAFDAAFGSGGLRYLDNGPDTEVTFLRVALQGDGKVVAVGSMGRNGESDSIVARFNANGTPDTSFGTNGVIRRDLGTADEAFTDVRIQPDGKIVVSGYAEDDRVRGRELSARGTVARFLSDGRSDASFSGDGLVTIDEGKAERLDSLALLPDGRIVAVGSVTLSEIPTPYYSTRAIVVRLTSSGAFDASFNGNGRNVFDVGAGNESLYRVAVLADRSVVAVGGFGEGMGEKGVAVKLGDNGKLVSSFGTNGVASLPTRVLAERYTDLSVRPDGKIVAVGASRELFDVGAGVIARFNANGTADTSFGTGGRVSVRAEGNLDTVFAGLAFGNDGKMIISGGRRMSTGGLPGYFQPVAGFVARFSAAGVLDTSFASLGYRVAPPSGWAYALLAGVVVRPDQKIVAVGYSSYETAFESRTRGMVVQLTTDAPPPAPPPVATFSQSASWVGEAGKTARVAVTLSKPAASAVTVRYATTGVTATAGSDYTAPSGTLVIPAGATTGYIDVAIKDDALVESPESLRLNLTSATGATLGTAVAHTVTINDNDRRVPLVSIAQRTALAQENEGDVVRLTVLLSMPAPTGMYVDVRPAGEPGPGVASFADYALTTWRVYIPAGATTGTIELRIFGDRLDEGDETIRLQLVNPVNAALGAGWESVVTIRDND